jgi:hypothetical protein
MSVGCLVTSPTLPSASFIRAEKAHTRRTPQDYIAIQAGEPSHDKMFDKTCKRHVLEFS